MTLQFIPKPLEAEGSGLRAPGCLSQLPKISECLEQLLGCMSHVSCLMSHRQRFS